MNLYDKNNQIKTLFDNSEIKPISFNANDGYRTIYNYSKRIGNLCFFIIGVEKTNGSFNYDDENIGTFNANVELGSTFCGLGTTDWSIEDTGYVFINNNIIIVSDRGNNRRFNRVFINTVCISRN